MASMPPFSPEFGLEDAYEVERLRVYEHRSAARAMLHAEDRKRHFVFAIAPSAPDD